MTIVRLLQTVEPYDWPLTLRMIGAHTVPAPNASTSLRERTPGSCPPLPGRRDRRHTDTRPRCLSRHPDAAVAEEVVAGFDTG